MRKAICLVLAGLFHLCFLFGQEDPTKLVPGELLVQLTPGLEPAQLEADLRRSQGVARIYHDPQLSNPFGIHLFRYDQRQTDGATALAILRKHPRVIAAQYNHRLDLRQGQAIDPNDPQYSQQWHLKNTGQISGGTADADIDADQAWDLTTGGPSSLGDTLVVAVIDDGFDLNHPDLRWWKNTGEIPQNGLDDDGNGYIDDYDGWNAFSQSGNIPNALHGTQVAGVIGAIGDNSRGVSGVAWDLQMMPVAGASSSESVVIEAYGYVLEQRHRYDQSNGQAGAYVVATNSSFGVDNGDPANFPLWCGIYDSLGQAGIINVAATMNKNQNVETAGDVPIRCSSDYLIGVSSSNPADGQYTGAAFGATSIDLVAPGVSIRTTSPAANYSSPTGTSFAAPQVTATLALMFTRACPAVMLQYQNDPSSVLLDFRQLILQGVDTLSTLGGFSATGGRLNAFRSLSALDTLCAGIPGGCLPPYRISAISATDTSARISWSAVDTTALFRLRYRLQGGNLWSDSLTVDSLSAWLTGLIGCSDYEYQIGTLCGPDTVAYASVQTFTANGCCFPPENLRLTDRKDSSLALTWDPVFGADTYQVQYRVAGSGDPWLTQSSDSTALTLQDLINCTSYEVAVKVICDGIDQGFGPAETFLTLGCGACLDQNYCPSRGTDVSFEWIQRVQVGNLDNNSGPNNGFGSFVNLPFILAPGQPIDVTLTPGYADASFEEVWRIWIDLNQNGVFEGEELLLDSGPNQDAYQGSLTIPDTVPLGNTRMRVSMRFAGFTGTDRPEACQVFVEGEVEDYCVQLLPDSLNPCPAPSEVAGRFRQDSLLLSWVGESSVDSFEVQLTNLETSSTEIFFTDTTELLVTNRPSCMRYQVRVRSRCGAGLSAFSPELLVVSPGCGNCRDLPYCPGYGTGDSLWISYVELGELVSASGNDGGYGDYLDEAQVLNRSTNYRVALASGFLGETDTVHWNMWADWNQDGNFWLDDQWISGQALAGDTLRGTIPVPRGVADGQIRLRIAVRRDQSAAVCEIFGPGEVEDYCLSLEANVNVEANTEQPWRVYPVPAREQLHVEAPAPLRQVWLYDATGRLLRSEKPQQSTLNWSVSAVPAGVYLLRAIDQRGQSYEQLIRIE